MTLRFEWDRGKSLLNKEKHGVCFDEARSAFYDDNALLLLDPGDYGEERFLQLGLSSKGREATKSEAVNYWRQIR